MLATITRTCSALKDVTSYLSYSYGLHKSPLRFAGYASSLPASDLKTAGAILDEALRLTFLRLHFDVARTLRRKGARPATLSRKEMRHMFCATPLSVLEKIDVAALRDLVSPTCFYDVVFYYIGESISSLCRDTEDRGMLALTEAEVSVWTIKVTECVRVLWPADRFQFLKFVCAWNPSCSLNFIFEQRKAALIKAFLEAGADPNKEDGVCFICLVKSHLRFSQDSVMLALLESASEVDSSTRHFREAYALFVLNSRRCDVVERFTDKIVGNWRRAETEAETETEAVTDEKTPLI